MDAERIEGVVIAEPCLDNGDGRIADGTADQTDEDGGECRDESRRRGDGDEPRNTAGDGTEEGRLAVAPPLGEYP